MGGGGKKGGAAGKASVKANAGSDASSDDDSEDDEVLVQDSRKQKKANPGKAAGPAHSNEGDGGKSSVVTKRKAEKISEEVAQTPFQPIDPIPSQPLATNIKP